MEERIDQPRPIINVDGADYYALADFIIDKKIRVSPVILFKSYLRGKPIGKPFEIELNYSESHYDAISSTSKPFTIYIYREIKLT